MATVKIIIMDKADEVNLKIDFDPPLHREEGETWDDVDTTLAQQMGMVAIQALRQAYAVEGE